jgi:hypothetical protein
MLSGILLAARLHFNISSMPSSLLIELNLLECFSLVLLAYIVAMYQVNVKPQSIVYTGFNCGCLTYSHFLGSYRP